jgi:S-layer homology domain
MHTSSSTLAISLAITLVSALGATADDTPLQTGLPSNTGSGIVTASCAVTNTCASGSNSRITSVEPSMNNGSSTITVKANTSLASAAAVYFGTTAVTSFTANSDGSLAVYIYNMPFPLAGSKVPVSVLLKGQGGQTMVYGTATFEVQLGTMVLNGPLAYDLNAVDDWTSQPGTGRNFGLPAASNLMFNQPPVFHVHSELDSTSNQWQSGPTYPNPRNVGNLGLFIVNLEMCDSAATSGDGQCTNFDGSTGYWQSATGKPGVNSSGYAQFAEDTVALINNKTFPANPLFQAHLVPLIQGGVNADDTLTLDTSSMFNQQNLVRTFRLDAGIALTDTNDPGTPSDRFDQRYSAPFNVVVAPAAFLQVKAQPVAIVYAPPGNQSTASLTTTTSYNTTYNFGNSNTTTNKETAETVSSQSVSMSMGLKASVGVANVDANFSEGDGETWDNSTTDSVSTQSGKQTGLQSGAGFSITYPIGADPLTVPGSGLVCAAATATSKCPSTSVDPNWQLHQPFMTDLFFLMVHPQYALYEVGKGQQQTVLYHAAPVIIEAPVLLLSECATGQVPEQAPGPCTFTYPESTEEVVNGKTEQVASVGTMTLTQAEANNLLALDPFYEAGTQNADIPPTRGVMVAPIVYGNWIGFDTRPNPVALNEANTNVSNWQQNGTTTYGTSVSSAESETTSMAAGFSVGYIFTEGLSGNWSTQTKETNEVDTQTQYSNSTAVSNQTVVTITGSLSDFDNQILGSNGPLCKNCHDPLQKQPSVNVYQDKILGGMMFQDPAAPPSVTLKPWQVVTSASLVELYAVDLQQEQRLNRFSDVEANSPDKAAIGMVARTGVMIGYVDGTFHPSQGFSRGDLAIALAAGLKLNLPAAQTSFSDVASGDYAGRAAEAAVKAGVLKPPTAGKLGTTDVLTRQEVAIALVSAFKPKSTTTPTPKDIQTVPASARSQVTDAVSAGYIKLNGDFTFRPTATMSRAEAAEAFLIAIKKG